MNADINGEILEIIWIENVSVLHTTGDLFEQEGFKTSSKISLDLAESISSPFGFFVAGYNYDTFIGITNGNTAQSSITKEKILSDCPNTNQIRIYFSTSNGTRNESDIKIIPGKVEGIIDRIENIDKEINSINKELENLKDNETGSNYLIIDPGRFIKCTVKDLENSNSFEDTNTLINNKPSTRVNSNNESKIEVNFEEEAEINELIGLFFYLPWGYKGTYKNPDGKLEVVTFEYYYNNDKIDSVFYYDNVSGIALNGGWNYIPYKSSSNKINKIVITVTIGDSITDYSYNVGNYINLGRKNKPAIAITFDGGSNNSTLNCGAYNLLDSLNIPFIVFGDTEDTFESEAHYKLEELEKKGLCKFSIYTNDLVNEINYTISTAIDYIKPLKSVMLNYNTRGNSISIAPRFNANNRLISQSTREEGYKIIRTATKYTTYFIGEEEGLNTIKNFSNSGAIYPESEDVYTTETEQSDINLAKEEIDTLINKGYYSVMVFHQVSSREDINKTPWMTGIRGGISYGFLEGVLNYLKEKRDSGELIITTMDNLYNLGILLDK